MKRLVALFLCLLTGLVFVHAGPFGLSNGMTMKEVTKACGGKAPVRIDNDDRYYIQPEKSHPMFKEYIAWISDDFGLYNVKGVSESIATNAYGEEFKDEFYSFLYRLKNIYGEPELVDKIVDPNCSERLKKDDYWLTAFRNGARACYAEWTKENKNAKLKDGLESVFLGGTCSLLDKTYLYIEYEFENQKEVEKYQDDVL